VRTNHASRASLSDIAWRVDVLRGIAPSPRSPYDIVPACLDKEGPWLHVGEANGEFERKARMLGVQIRSNQVIVAGELTI
jgi:hypothetical protein